MKIFLLIFFLFLIHSNTAFSENMTVFEFTNEEKKLLKVRKIKKVTTYTLGSNEGRRPSIGVGNGKKD